jgi:hypothetical protein
MPYSTQKLTLAPAKVTSTNINDRLVNVAWIGRSAGVNNVLVLGSHGNLSFPKVGDVGLVARFENWAYYLGNIEYGYAKKVAGEIKDERTGETILTKLVKDGEVFITNMLKQTFLSFPNSGDMGLLNGLSEGIKYLSKYRLLKTAALTLQFAGNGVMAALGSVIRDLPGQGPTVSLGDSLTPAVEAYIEVKENGVKLGRAHLGYVKDTTLGIDEISSFGSRLRGILEVTAGPAPLASLKIDEVSNIELTSMTGKLKQSAPLGIELTAASGSIKQTALSSIEHSVLAGNFMADGVQIKLGGASANQSVIKGTTYTTAESAFMDALTVFSSALLTFVSGLNPATLTAQAVPMVAATTTLKTAISNFKVALTSALSAKTFTV